MHFKGYISQILYRRVHEAVFKILEANETMELTMASYALLVEIAQVSVLISTQESMIVISIELFCVFIQKILLMTQLHYNAWCVGWYQ